MKYILIILFLTNVYQSIAQEHSFVIKYDDVQKPSIGLALSGGGARGLSQIGVLQYFEEKGLGISYIVGTSIGAIVGGLYTNGYNASELSELLSSNDWRNTLALSKNKRSELFLDQKDIYDKSLFSIKFKNFSIIEPEAISAGNPFDEFLQKVFWNAPTQPELNFDSFKIPFRAVATDLVSGKSKTFSTGNISKIVRASATIPLRYTPIRIDSMILVDGGILSNIPTQQLIALHPDIKLAVDATSPLYDKLELTNVWTMADQVLSVAIQHIADSSKKLADIVIQPELGNIRNDDFSNIDTLIDLGYSATKQSYASINNLYLNKYKIKLMDKFKVELNTINNYPLLLKLKNFPQSFLDTCQTNNAIIEDIDSLLNLLVGLLNSPLQFEYLQINNLSNTLEIEFNSRAKLKNISLESNITTIDINELRKAIESKESKYNISKNTVYELRLDIIKYLKNKGINYPKVKVLEYNDSIKVLIDKYKIHRIIIDGSDVSDFIIKRDLQIKEGDELTIDNLLMSWEYLKSTDLFSNVEIYPYLDTNANMNVRVKLKDGGTQVVKLGGRVDSERNAQGSLYLIQENLFNFGARLGYNLIFSETYLYNYLKFENSRFINTDLNLALELYYNTWQGFEYKVDYNKDNTAYTSTRNLNYEVNTYGIKLTGGVQIGRGGNLYSSVRFEQQQYYKKSDTIKMDYYPISTIKFGVIWDNLNDLYFPTKGRVLNLSLETNLIQAKNIVGFSKISTYFNTIFPLNSNIFNFELTFGAADATLPYPEFFMAGGMNSFFGYRSEELLGRQIFKSSLGYRTDFPIDIFFDTYFFARYDVGNVWVNYENIELNNLKHGFGLGLALNTPIGPAKFAWGKSLFFRKYLKELVFGQTILYFSIGVNLN
ncbi:MAG TPA: patatin-like phospholipase family protein [Candidatus Kapabacteria bacterium]|nr:patatin-like phospholipase family protein [Candidatus Kapabacteria bacterium]